MSGRSTTQVLFRSLGSALVDLGMVAFITALAAWAKAEKFVPGQLRSDSGESIWSTVDQARRDELAEDSWNRMQKVGNTEYVWTRNSLLVVGLVGLASAAVVFLLIPAIIRTTIGRKLFGLRSKRKPGGTGVDHGRLDRRFESEDDPNNVIDLDTRLADVEVPQHPGEDLDSVSIPLTEPAVASDSDSAAVSTRPPEQIFEPTPEHMVDSSGAQHDLLPIDVLPLPTAAIQETLDAPSDSLLKTETSPAFAPEHQPIDVEAGGLLGMEVREESSSSWPEQSSGYAVDETSAEAEQLAEAQPDVDQLQPLPPPPLHRSVNWDPPRAEPAPVWSPEADDLTNANLLEQDTDHTAEIQPTTSSAHTTEAVTTAMSTTEPVTTVVSRTEAATSHQDTIGQPATTPIWNEEWQAWIFWNQDSEQWLRHDVEANTWTPLT